MTIFIFLLFPVNFRGVVDSLIRMGHDKNQDLMIRGSILLSGTLRELCIRKRRKSIEGSILNASNLLLNKTMPCPRYVKYLMSLN